MEIGKYPKVWMFASCPKYYVSPKLTVSVLITQIKRHLCFKGS